MDKNYIDVAIKEILLAKQVTGIWDDNYLSGALYALQQAKSSCDKQGVNNITINIYNGGNK